MGSAARAQIVEAATHPATIAVKRIIILSPRKTLQRRRKPLATQRIRASLIYGIAGHRPEASSRISPKFHIGTIQQ
jgi:hypothetical protein